MAAPSYDSPAPVAEGASVPLDPLCAPAQLRSLRSRWSLAY